MSKRRERTTRKRLRRIEAAGPLPEIKAEAAPIQWIEAADGEGEPKPGKFTINAYNGGPMVVNRWADPVVIDLSGLEAKAPLPVLRDHDIGRIVGHATEVANDGKRLSLSGIVSGAGPHATEVVASAKAGFPWRASVGAKPLEREYVPTGVKVSINGRSLVGPLYVARKAVLGEVSFVAVGADSGTSAKVAAAAARFNHKEIDMKFEQWIQAMGLELEELREDQVTKLRAKYDAEVKAAKANDKQDIKAGNVADPPGPAAPTFDIQAIGVAFAQHEATIEAKAVEYGGKVDAQRLAEVKAAGMTSALDLKATAIKEKWAGPRLEAEYVKAAATYEADLIRAERPQAPAIHSSTRDMTQPVIEAAFCRSAGLAEPEKHFKPETLEAADKGFRNFGLQEMLLLAAGLNGYTGRQRVGVDNLREVLTAAFQPIRAAGGFSGIDVSGILSSSANKILLEGFNQVPQTWREVARTRSVSDFKSVTAYRLTADLEYAEVGPTGEITHGELGEESYSMQAKTYAKMLTLTRQDIINDDLGAFDDLRTRLGLGAALKMNKVFWTLWVNNSTFFTSARGNYQSGAGTALGDAAIADAVTLFRQMEGPDGNLLSLEPDRLVVPPELEATARQFYVSQEIRDTTASTKRPTANIYQNRFKPIVVPELSNSSYTGYSALAWYLLANPAVLATAVMCFLNGVQSPTIESADADFNTLGVQMRGYHDFGVAMAEYRGGVKSKGEA